MIIVESIAADGKVVRYVSESTFVAKILASRYVAFLDPLK